MRPTSVLIVVAAFAAGVLVDRSSRTQAQEQNVLPALLTEVRGLRAAIEQMASAGPRVQLTLGRLQLQEQRINTMIRRLETVRDSLASAQREASQYQSQIAHSEALVREHTPGAPGEKDALDQVLVGLKSQLARASGEAQRLTAEESSIAGDIATEQARWTEFNQRLEELERALGKK